MSYEGGKNEEIYIGNMSRAYVYNALVWQNMVVCFQKSRRYARQTRKRKCHIPVLLPKSFTWAHTVVTRQPTYMICNLDLPQKGIWCITAAPTPPPQENF